MKELTTAEAVEFFSPAKVAERATQRANLLESIARSADHPAMAKRAVERRAAAERAQADVIAEREAKLNAEHRRLTDELNFEHRTRELRLEEQHNRALVAVAEEAKKAQEAANPEPSDDEKVEIGLRNFAELRAAEAKALQECDVVLKGAFADWRRDLEREMAAGPERVAAHLRRAMAEFSQHTGVTPVFPRFGA